MLLSFFRIEGLKVCGESVSPIVHVQLAEPSGDRDQDKAILQDIVQEVRMYTASLEIVRAVW